MMLSIVILLLLILIGAVALGLYLRSTGARQPELKAPPAPDGVTLRSLRPGDVMSLWASGEHIVKSVLQCREEIGVRITQWQWVFLDDGRILEVTPGQVLIFGPFEAAYQGTEVFEQLVPPGGILGVFEERVREGEIGRNPVYFDFHGRRYRVASTGTFTATLEGEALDQDIWRDLSPHAADNVFFKLELVGTTPVSGNGSSEKTDAASPPRPEGEPEAGLGVWTTHILLGLGRPLDEHDIKGLYGGR